MPIYEFQCNGCAQTLSIFQRRITAPVTARCDRCGSGDLRRLVSTFAFHRAAGAIDLETFDEQALIDGVDENDPKAMAEWAKRMGDRLGPDMGPEFEAMADQMAAGAVGGDDFGTDDTTFGDDF